MHHQVLRLLAPALLSLASLIAPAPVLGQDVHSEQAQFNRDIRPILSDKCFACHGPDLAKRKAGLRLDLRDAATAKLASGASAIVPGQCEKSELVARVFAAEESERMPPARSGKVLTPREKQLLKSWIAQGAVYQPHWSLIPPSRPSIPAVKGAPWSRNPIDHFIQARLEKEGLAPSPPVDKTTLLRRVTLDLTGLPPTPAEVESFLADPSPTAYDRTVDRLLASPRFGERMASDWLDAARYADSNGYQVDRDREMWPWRDWVVRAFNANQPFDQFTIEQLAGDLLPNPTRDQRIATGFNRNNMLNEEGGIIPEEFLTEYVADRAETTATVWLGLTVGCARCHDHKFDPITQKDYYGLFAFFHNVPERGVGNFGGPPKQSAPPLLQLSTPQEARKFDDLAAAIKKLEQQLSAMNAQLLAGQSEWEKSLTAPGAVSSAIAASSGLTSKVARIEAARREKKKLPAVIVQILDIPRRTRRDKQRTELRDYYREKISPLSRVASTELARLRKERTELEERVPTMMVMSELPKPRETFMLVRGQYDKKGERVAPATPANLPALPPSYSRDRLGLAQWLTAPGNPLTARVIVNRYWQAYFGIGLVRTAEDFGSQGEPPSHAELLDWLATEFVRSGWNVKHMQKLIVTSATYRQSSRSAAGLRERDPENRLLGRGPRFRLPAEMIRDQALAASGLLVERRGGPPVKPYHPSGIYEQIIAQGGKTYQQSKGPDLYRRSLYTYWKRSVPHPAMLALDAPFREICTVRRARTSTPLQALNLMNDPTYVEAARFLAQRMLLEGGSQPEQRISFGFRLAVARSPRTDELTILMNGLRQMLADFQENRSAAEELLRVGESPPLPCLDRAELAAYSTVASTLLNLDETITKE